MTVLTASAAAPLDDVPEAIRKLIDQTVSDFRAARLRQSETKSFLRGTWQVFARHHPDLTGFKVDFFSLAGDALKVPRGFERFDVAKARGEAQS